jgi:hypothetical protein
MLNTPHEWIMPNTPHEWKCVSPDTLRPAWTLSMSRLFAQWPEARPDLCREHLWLLPRCEVPTFAGLVVVDEVVVGPLRPALGGLVVLAGEGAHGRRDGNVGGVVQGDFVLPVQAGRGDSSVGQPVERDVVQDIVSREVTRGMPMAGAGCR